MELEQAENSKPTVDQVKAAFQQLFGNDQGRTEEPGEVADAQQATNTEATEAVDTTTPQVSTESPGQPDSTPPTGEVEDVAALRLRLTELEGERDSISERAAKNLEWARGLGLRKASEADRLRTVLKQIAEGKEIERAEVERILAIQDSAANTQNSLVPFQAAAPPPQVDENTQLEAEQFVMDYRLNDKRAGEFKSWLDKPDNGLTNKDVVPGSLYHTLALAYGKYQQAISVTNPATVKAVQSLQRTQREVARASGTVTTRAKPSTPAEPPVDLMKLAKTDVEGFRKHINIADLMQQVARGE